MVQILWTTFEAAVTTKNKVIQTLLSDLEEAEIQYSMMLENHMQVINRLIGTVGNLALILELYFLYITYFVPNVFWKLPHCSWVTSITKVLLKFLVMQEHFPTYYDIIAVLSLLSSISKVYKSYIKQSLFFSGKEQYIT